MSTLKDEAPWGLPPSIRPGARGTQGLIIRKATLVVAVAAVALGTALGSIYTVQPTEMAAVRRFGTVVSDRPVGPGLHFKLPWIDTVDTIQTSLEMFQLKDLTVYTVDNQPVGIGIGVSYRVPETAVLKLLYGVGRSGNVDIAENIRPVIADRVMRVFSTQNVVSISAERETIAAEIRKQVSEALTSMFGLEVADLQISSIGYSPSFQASVEAAVQAKNDAIRAENTVVRVRYEGEQAKVQADAQAAVRIAQANGDAQATVAQARGAKEAAVLRAEGEAQATALTGEMQAKVIAEIGAAVAANPGVVRYEQAHRWNGQMPTTVLGGGASPLTMLSLAPNTAPGEAQPPAP